MLLLNRKGWFLWHFLNLCSTFILLLSCFLSCCTRKRTKIHVFVPAAVRWLMDFAVDGLFLAAFLICQHVHIDRSTPPSHEWAFDVKEQTICRSLGRESQRSVSCFAWNSSLLWCTASLSTSLKSKGNDCVYVCKRRVNAFVCADVHKRMCLCLRHGSVVTCGLEWGMQARCIHGNLVSVQSRVNNHYGLCAWERERERVHLWDHHDKTWSKRYVG